jgi:hypothetical protein
MGALEIVKGPRLQLKLEGRDYTLVFNMPIVAALGETLKRSMTSAPDWWRIQPKELPSVLRAGLETHHADDMEAVVEAICGADGAGPEVHEMTIEALCAANWPEATRRYNEERQRLRDLARKGMTLPNAPSADAD